MAGAEALAAEMATEAVEAAGEVDERPQALMASRATTHMPTCAYDTRHACCLYVASCSNLNGAYRYAAQPAPYPRLPGPRHVQPFRAFAGPRVARHRHLFRSYSAASASNGRRVFGVRIGPQPRRPTAAPAHLAM